jgi:hypothetical protein
MPLSTRIADISRVTDVVFVCFGPEVLAAYRRAGVPA